MGTARVFKMSEVQGYDRPTCRYKEDQIIQGNLQVSNLRDVQRNAETSCCVKNPGGIWDSSYENNSHRNW